MPMIVIGYHVREIFHYKAGLVVLVDVAPCEALIHEALRGKPVLVV